MVYLFFLAFFITTLNAVEVIIENNSSSIISVIVKRNNSDSDLVHVQPKTSMKLEVKNIEKTKEFLKNVYQNLIIESEDSKIKIIN